MDKLIVDLETGESSVVPMTQEELDARPVVPLAVPAAITRSQCALEMLARTMISDVEALAMVQNGTAPAMVVALLDAAVQGGQMTAGDKTLSLIQFARDTYERANPLLNQLMTAEGADTAAIDDFFRSAATR